MSRDDAVLLDMVNAAQRIVEFKEGTADRDVPALIAELRRLSGPEEPG